MPRFPTLQPKILPQASWYIYQCIIFPSLVVTSFQSCSLLNQFPHDPYICTSCLRWCVQSTLVLCLSMPMMPTFVQVTWDGACRAPWSCVWACPWCSGRRGEKPRGHQQLPGGHQEGTRICPVKTGGYICESNAHNYKTKHGYDVLQHSKNCLRLTDPSLLSYVYSGINIFSL